MLATYKIHTVGEFVDFAFEQIGVAINWQSESPKECGIQLGTGVAREQLYPRYFRSTGADYLIGDARKAEEFFGWKTKTRFHKLVAGIVAADCAAIAKGQPQRRTSD